MFTYLPQLQWRISERYLLTWKYKKNGSYCIVYIFDVHVLSLLLPQIITQLYENSF